MIHNISITEEALKEVAKEVCCTFSTLKHLLGIEEHIFKPFDKVLVRNDINHTWKARFFEKYTFSDSYPFQTIDGVCCWKYCIPYEGNEDKLSSNN